MHTQLFGIQLNFVTHMFSTINNANTTRYKSNTKRKTNVVETATINDGCDEIIYENSMGGRIQK